MPKSRISDHMVQFAPVFVARDRCWAIFCSYFQFTNLWFFSEHRDVVIKVVSKGYEGLRALERGTDPASATVPIVEFLQI